MWGRLVCTTSNCKNLVLEKSEIIIGRNNEEMELNDQRISRKHCVLKKDTIGNEKVIKLISTSSSGTYLNNNLIEVNEEIVLIDFDEITLLEPSYQNSISFCYISNSFLSNADEWNQCEILNKYKIGKYLGSGSFATVRKVQNLRTNEWWAMKIVKKEICSMVSLDMKREVEIIQQLHHTNLVQCKEIIESEKYLFIILDLVEGSDMFDYLFDQRKGVNYISEEKAKDVMKQIFNAVNYLHQNGICHRDIKVENILVITSNNNDIISIKLTDFGFGKIIDQTQKTKTKVGSDAYKAPELFASSEIDYDPFKVDIWACGVVLYLMVIGDYPFGDDSTHELIKNVSNGLYNQMGKFKELSEECMDLLENMFNTDPKSRFTIEECLNHHFITRKRRKAIKEETREIPTL